MRRYAALLAAAAMIAAPLLAAGPAASVTAYVPFSGGVHFHSAYSDGAARSRPIDVLRAGSAAGMDFMFVTEHSEWLRLPVEADSSCLTGGRPPQDCLITTPDGLDKWNAQAQAGALAESEAPGFLALRGFEWSSPLQGHVGVLLGSNVEDAYTDGGVATMEGLYRWLTRPAALGGGGDALATFNHPGREAGKFETFRYAPDADAQMVGLEIFNRANDYSAELANALEAGWHVGAVGAVDEHGPAWGRSDRARTIVLAPIGAPWNAATVRDALAARRFYASQDADLVVTLDADGAPMGSRLTHPAGSPLMIAVSATDPGGVAVSTIEMISATGTVAFAGPATTAVVAATGGETWHFFRITLANGKKAYPSPVWVTWV